MAEQDRILGYFLDEAQEHLKTIEAGLTNPVTLAQPAQLKEVFRAAHSIKGGAAMLDLPVVQQIGHHLEQAFKQIKDNSLVVDSGLQTSLQEGLALLRTSLQDLEQQQPDNLQLAQNPVFEKIRRRLQAIEQSSGSDDSDNLYADPAIEQVFGNYVNQKLQQFAETCRKPQAEVAIKQELQQICQKVGSLGESFEFLAWTNLLISCRLAINNPLNSIEQLQEVIPPAIQQAQMLVIAGKHHAITSTPELEILLTPNALNVTRTPTALEKNGAPFALEDSLWDEADPSESHSFSSSHSTDSDFLFEPQMVGPEEPLDDLAEFMELFDEDLPVDGTWVQEENVLAEELAAPAATLDPFWEEDIFARPMAPSGALTPPLANAAVVNLPQFDFEQPNDSDLFVEDLPITAVDPTAKPQAAAIVPPVSLTPAAATIDWSGLLADIPDEVVMEYDRNNQNANSSQEMELWSLDEQPSTPPTPLDINPTPPTELELWSLEEPSVASPVPDAIPSGIAPLHAAPNSPSVSHPDLDLEPWNIDEFLDMPDAIEMATSAPLAASPADPFAPLDFSSGSGSWDAVAPIVTDFAVNEEPASPFDNPFQPLHPEPTGSDLLSPAPSDHWNFSDDLSSMGNSADLAADLAIDIDMDMDLDAIFQTPPLAESLSPLISPLSGATSPVEEVAVSHLPDSIASPPIPAPSPPPPEILQPRIVLDADYLKELAIFDDLLADTKITDVDLADLDQIVLNGNLEEELELENIEDFSPASVSPNPLVAPDNLTEATPRPLPNPLQQTVRELENIDRPVGGSPELAMNLDELDLLDLSPLGELPALDGELNATELDAMIEGIEGLDLMDLSDLDLAPVNQPAEDSAVGDNWAIDLDQLSAFSDQLGAMDSLGDLDFASFPDASVVANATAAESMELDALEMAELDHLMVGGSDLDDFLADSNAHLPDLAAPAETMNDLDSLFAASDNFADLDSMLAATTVAAIPAAQNSAPPTTAADDDEFNQLEKMLQRNDSSKAAGAGAGSRPTSTKKSGSKRQRTFEQTMKVSVKNLNNLNNLTGELVVNRNTLEQDQNRMRQFLDKLLQEVQKMTEVGRGMQDLYEKSLLESSLLANRQQHQQPKLAPVQQAEELEAEGTMDMEYDPLEMDRFTPVHLLSQQLIELTVRIRESTSDIEFVVDSSGEVTRSLRQITSQLQEDLNKSRMLPFTQTTDRLQRGVRDNGLKYGKEVELHVEGGDTPIDKVILESLSDPLVHMVNNAIAHGIESPEQRIAVGKPPEGSIKIRAFHQGTQTIISVEDDGGGIDTEIVKSKAISKGIITPEKAVTMTKQEVYDLLFLPSFSTRDQADELAGRGIGMDVVLSSLQEIRGTVTTESKVGKGTTFTIRLPLALSITKALMAMNNEASIAFPMDGIEDSQDIAPEDVVENEAGQKCFYWRGNLMPFRPLSDLLCYNRPLKRVNYYGNLHQEEEERVSIVVLRSATELVAIEVDRVIGEQEIVIKPLQGPAPKPVGIAGATVLGDGRIIPITDVLELIDLANGTIGRQNTSLWSIDQPIEEQPAQREPMVLVVDDSITVRQLLSLTFTKAGYRVEQARDGQEAWDKLRAGLPCDIIFCDIEMPRMDGLELLSKVQQDETIKKIPMAMLTSRGSDRHRQIASQLGASGYFIKPYLEDALLEAVKRMIKGEVLAIV
jgi:chemotaxis protein histidine kinase CheA/ActR/RegA family two-component response regulator